MLTKTYIVDFLNPAGGPIDIVQTLPFDQEDLVIHRVALVPLARFNPTEWPTIFFDGLTLAGRAWITDAQRGPHTVIFAPGINALPFHLPVRKNDVAKFTVHMFNTTPFAPGYRLLIQGRTVDKATEKEDFSRETFLYDFTPQIGPGSNPVVVNMEDDYEWNGFLSAPSGGGFSTGGLYGIGNSPWATARQTDNNYAGGAFIFTANGPTFFNKFTAVPSPDQRFFMRYQVAQEEWRTKFLNLNVVSCGIPYAKFTVPVLVKKNMSADFQISQSAQLLPGQTAMPIHILTVGDHRR